MCVELVCLINAIIVFFKRSIHNFVIIKCTLTHTLHTIMFAFIPILQERGEDSQPMKEEDLISLIDDVLRDDDKNDDGYIDYAEFAKSLE